MFGVDDLGLITANMAFGRNQIGRIQQFTAAVTLVTSSVIILAMGAGTQDESISQKSIACEAFGLLKSIFEGKALRVEGIEYALADFSLLRGTCLSPIIKIDVEPVVNLGVESVIEVTNLLGCLLFGKSLCFSGSTILVSTTNVDSIVASESGPSGINITTQDATNQVTKMGDIVDVGKGRGDQNIFLILGGKDNLSLVQSLDLAFAQLLLDFQDCWINRLFWLNWGSFLWLCFLGWCFFLVTLSTFGSALRSRFFDFLFFLSSTLLFTFGCSFTLLAIVSFLLIINLILGEFSVVLVNDLLTLFSNSVNKLNDLGIFSFVLFKILLENITNVAEDNDIQFIWVFAL